MSSVPFIFAGNTGNIPLSQLDVNFANVKLSVDYVIQNTQANINTLGTLTNLSVAGNVVVNRNMLVSGNATVTGNTAHGNITSLGIISAAGNILSNSSISATGSVFANANVRVGGLISAIGNIGTANNIFASGFISAAGNLQSNTGVLVNGFVSATGNTFANVANVNQLNAGFATISHDLLVQGNATVNGTTTTINVQTLNIADKDIVVANNVSTSALIDGAGILAGNPTVAYITYEHANLAWTTGSSFIVGANLVVVGNAFSSTAANGTVSNEIATTQFVANAVTTGLSTLGSLSTQNANTVNITGGVISGITDLAVADGGTGASTFQANSVLLANGSDPFQSIVPGAPGNLLTSNGTTWVSGYGAAVGPGQTWQDLSGSRGVNVTYLNSSGRPITVLVTVVNTGGASLYINSSIVIRQFYDVNTGAGQVGYSFVTAVIPDGSSYYVTGGNLYTWWELR